MAANDLNSCVSKPLAAIVLTMMYTPMSHMMRDSYSHPVLVILFLLQYFPKAPCRRSRNLAHTVGEAVKYHPMCLLPDTYNNGLRMRRECRKRFPRHRLQRNPLVSDPGIHHGTCITHVPRCMSGSLTRGSGENVPGIPGASATCNFTYLARGPCCAPHFFMHFSLCSMASGKFSSWLMEQQ